MAKNTKVADFVTQMLDRCVIPKVPGVRAVKEVKDKDGNVVVEAVEAVKMQPARLDSDQLVDLAARNHIDAEKFRGVEPKDAGRARMTVGNMLRARAHLRHGLYDIDGNWIDAPEGFLAPDNTEPRETRDGQKIPKAKAEKAEEAAE